MFTGIIEDIGIVKALEKKQNYRLSVDSPIFKGLKTGESIAVNGVCLTISDLNNSSAMFDIMNETIKRTNLGDLKARDKVNLERALKVGDRLSGHFVTGHIDCQGRITAKDKTPGNYYLKVRIPEDYMKFIVPKGSIALDGISLTIADISADSLTVYLIPQTTQKTNLEFKGIGDMLNMEFDLIGKYILNRANREKEKAMITEKFLREHGY